MQEENFKKNDALFSKDPESCPEQLRDRENPSNATNHP
jgi:hypothetical protein